MTKPSSLLDTRVIHCGGNLDQLRKIPAFEFENWAVIALGGILNKTQVGDMGIDGRIYPVGAMPTDGAKANPELDFMDIWYPVQVKQMDKVGRPDIDKFEAAMIRANRTRGFFVAFDYTQDSVAEASRFFTTQRREITLLTVRDILGEQIARKKMDLARSTIAE